MTDRPRDRLGRPVPAGDARTFPGVVVPDGIDAASALALAADYLDRGLPFHAHEVFEARWRGAPPQQRAVWRALAQWAAGCTHAARGNRRGALALWTRAADGLAPFAADPVRAGLVAGDGRVVDVTAMVTAARAGRAAPQLPWRVPAT